MTLLVRNEEEMIEANLEYHLAQGVDFILVTDHASSDGTRDRLAPFERAGVVKVIDSFERGHHQSERVTAMARLLHEQHRADWIIHNDADEFWWPLSGRLRDVFAAIPDAYGQIVVPRHNFLPVPSGAGPFHSRMVYRETASRNLIGEPLEPKVAHRAHPDAVLRPGNHCLAGVALAPVPDLGLLEIFHFPMRTYEQFERKVIQIGEGYEHIENRGADVGRDQLELFKRHRAGALPRYWEDTFLDDPALARRLADGTVVLDRRLAAFMQSRHDGAAQPTIDGGAATRRLLSAALLGIRERDELHVRVRALEAELEAARSELAQTTASLDALQQSRLMRVTAPLRRRWYRMRGLD